MSAEIVYSTDALIDLDEAWDFTVETSDLTLDTLVPWGL